MHRALLSAVLSLSVLLSPLVAAQDAEYTYTTFDAHDTWRTFATGINDRGQIVGHVSPVTGDQADGFVTDGITFTPIKVPGAIHTSAVGINDDGQIVGHFHNADAPGRGHGFVTTDGVTFTAIDVPGAIHTEAYDINNRRQIVGSFRLPGTTRGFVTDGITFTSIEVPGAMLTYAWGINDDGQIVGWFEDATSTRHGFVTTDGVTFTAIDVPGARDTMAFGINDDDQIVGEFLDASATPHSFITDGATFTTLDLLGGSGAAQGINDRGQIVGPLHDDTGMEWHGFMATPRGADTTAPAITISASPTTLRPPNGQLVPVTVSGTITDEPGGTWVQTSTYRIIDEYGQIQPSGSITLVKGQYTFTVALREHGDAGDYRRTPVKWLAAFTHHSNPEEPRHACETPARHVQR